MRYIFKFPDIGEGITEGKILEWHIKKGQTVKSGEALVKMETDKVVTDIPSPKDGTVTNIFGKEGDVIKVDDPLVELEIEGVSGEEAQVIAHEKKKPKEEKPIDEKGFGVVGTLEVAGDNAFLPAGTEGQPTREIKKEEEPPKKVLTTPVARAMAKDMGIDINLVKGTGPAGRVTQEDVQHFNEKKQTIETKPTTKAPSPGAKEPQVAYEPLSQIRKAIARNMLRSKQSTAHMTVIEDVEVSELVKIRENHKQNYEARGLKLSYLPFILKATALALKEFPLLNGELDFENDRVILKKYYHIGIAVDTQEGLVVPVIRDVDKLSIFQLSEKIIETAELARKRKLSLGDFKDGTFTVTNYGSIGGTYGVPVINYPQAGILGVGRIMKMPVVKNDQIVIGHVMPLSMSVDHRIVDGAEAARFMVKIINFLKDPVSLLLN
ncbi:MAG: 2-oxo acid dehydrogenase subunit E2 [Acidobacteria bacterium]|jgi:pyruvate dehydrogenase E2 component (dihydrolipoamide acetyltransferase)|nr:2-oxo acid dehydrogenase subunit E2 [Acidobacteriota bacterium]